jgi:hypothetical protein
VAGRRAVVNEIMCWRAPLAFLIGHDVLLVGAEGWKMKDVIHGGRRGSRDARI